MAGSSGAVSGELEKGLGMSKPLGAVAATAEAAMVRAAAPARALAARLRRVRVLHRDAQTYMAEAQVHTRERRLLGVAARLEGTALVRLSAALWRRRTWPDLLGLGLRFFGRRGARPQEPPLQDLVLATSRSLLAVPTALLQTDVHDFLTNRYHSLGRMEVDGFGPVRVRARWRTPSPAGADRLDRLTAAVAEDLAQALVELQPHGSPEWVPFLAVELRLPAALEPGELRLSPFNDQGGLHPLGLLQALRFAPKRSASDAFTRTTPPRTSTGARR